MNSKPSLFKAALIGGGIAGVLGGIPFVSCLCCLLMIGGGMLAAFLNSREFAAAGAPFRVGNGAAVGAASGVVYAVASGIVGFVFNKLLAGVIPGAGGQPDFQEQFGDQMSPEQIEMFEGFAETMMGPAGMAIGLLIAVVFATIGGLIGGAIFKHEPPAETGGSAAPGGGGEGGPAV